MNTQQAIKKIIDKSSIETLYKKSFLETLRGVGMTVLYKTNLALISGYPRFFPHIIYEVNEELKEQLGDTQGHFDFTTAEDLRTTLRIIPLSQWITTEPIPDVIFDSLKEAQSLGIFNEYHIISPYPYGKEEGKSAFSFKDPLLVGSFIENKRKEPLRIVDYNEKNLEIFGRMTKILPYATADYDFYHIIGWWGHDMNFIKFGLKR